MKKKFSLFAAIALLVANILPISTAFAAGPHLVTADVTYTASGDEPADIFINGTMLQPGASTLEYEYDDSGSVKITLATFSTVAKITAANINGTDYTASLPTTKEALLEKVSTETDGQTINLDFTVPYAASYTISTTTEKFTPENAIVGSFLWSYMDQDRGKDDYFGDGGFELIKVKYNGVEYTEAQLRAANKGYLTWGENSDEGSAVLPVGAKVTVKMLPKAGYQLTKFTINGGEFATGDDAGVYSFDIKGGNFHLGAHFSAVADAVEASDADAITSGSITLDGDEFDNGTARLEVKNAEGLEPAEIENFEGNAEGYNLKTILDISLFNTIYKGSADATWDTQLDELDHEATITLKLDPSVDGNDVIIVHEKHDGTYEVIPTIYDPENHTITFKTSSFSNYAIATRTIASPNTGYMTREGGSVVENNVVVAILGTLALWGFLAFVAKKGITQE